MEKIRQRSVLKAVLLQVLAENAAGLETVIVYDTIDQTYIFPDEWYRQLPDTKGYDELKQLGFSDWRTVPQGQLIELVATEPQWKNEIRWARNDLRKQGFLDLECPRGLWKLSTTGMEAAKSVIANELNRQEKEIVGKKRKSPAKKKERHAPSTPGAGLRSELDGKLELLTHSMPLNDLQLLVEIARSIRKRSLPEDETAG